MRRIGHLSYRVKMLLVFGVSMLCLTVIVASALTVQSYRYMEQHIRSYLELLTEQSLMNFERETSGISRQFMNQLSAGRIPEFLYAFNENPDGLTSRRSREIAEALSRTITAGSGYDSVYIRALDGTSFTDTFADAEFIGAANRVLEMYENKNYGRPEWVRLQDGRVYLVRDVYHQQPFRFAGKAVARLQDASVIRLGEGELSRSASVCFFYEDRFVTVSAGEEAPAEQAALSAAENAGAGHMILSVRRLDRWRAVGLLPDSVLYAMNTGVIRAGLLILLIALILGSAVILIATRGMTRQIGTLLGAMDGMAGGDMAIRAPVTGGDEIGQLAEHFNTMARNNQTLMTRLVAEEKEKNKAEYDALEYRYRSLQSQINPHFIYNAMEVVNAMAKLSGQEEICEVVGHISSFFRQNTHNMAKRFITVREEFDSLKEYACIFRYIYGDVLETPFTCPDDTQAALIPTMILQPLMENALVHGVRAKKAVVAITAEKSGEEILRITVADNGAGMTEETLRRVLAGEAPAGDSGDRKAVNGVGLRNVRDRLALIYGDKAVFTVVSTPGGGTTVTVALPLTYTAPPALE